MTPLQISNTAFKQRANGCANTGSQAQGFYGAVSMHGYKTGESKCFVLEGGRLMKSADNYSAATVSMKYWFSFFPALMSSLYFVDYFLIQCDLLQIDQVAEI